MFLYYLNSINKFYKFLNFYPEKVVTLKRMRWSCKFKLQLNWVDPLGQNYNFKKIIIYKPKKSTYLFSKLNPYLPKLNILK